MADVPLAEGGMNALLRFWASVPDAARSWNPTAPQEPERAVVEGFASRLAAAAMTAGIDHAPGRPVTIVLPTPWTPAGASSFGDPNTQAPGVILWHRELLRAVAAAVDAVPRLSLRRMVRNEGIDHENGSTSSSIGRIVLSPASVQSVLPVCDPMATLRLLSDLHDLPGTQLARLVTLASVSSDPDFPEPLDR